MMAVDSSALVAITLREPDGKLFSAALLSAPGSLMSAVSLMELSFVTLSRMGEMGLREVAGLIEDYDIRVMPFDIDQAGLAKVAIKPH